MSVTFITSMPWGGGQNAKRANFPSIDLLNRPQIKYSLLRSSFCDHHPSVTKSVEIVAMPTTIIYNPNSIFGFLRAYFLGAFRGWSLWGNIDQAMNLTHYHVNNEWVGPHGRDRGVRMWRESAVG